MDGLTKVLIAEDNADIVEIYSLTLTRAGYEVASAVDGKLALDQILVFQPHVMLLDIMMPNLDGLEVLKSLQEKPEFQQNKPVVLVMTNLDQLDIIEQTKQLGARGYFVKANIVPHDLPSIIEETCKRINESESTN